MWNLVFTCIGLLVLQACAAVPWLIAVDWRNRQWLRQVKVWGTGLVAAVALGAVWAYFLQNSDTRDLVRWGRFYMSVLHLQLAADFFVVVFWLLLTFWPKGAAVALAAFQEGVRQPMFWLLFAAALTLMVMSPFWPYFTFGEDYKVVKEVCFALTMLLPAVFAVVAASISVSEEIEGRTAVTLMSKPISRRQFLLGKFGGLLLAAAFMTLLLGWFLVWVVVFKSWYDPPMTNSQEAISQADPRWVIDLAGNWFGNSALGDLTRGVGFWVNDAGTALPGLVIGFCQVMVLLAIAVALGTRVPMVITIPVCVIVFFLGHLTPIMMEVTRTGYRLIYFMAQLFDTILPGLDLFDASSAVIRDVPLPAGAYALYTLNVTLYALTYTTITLLFGLILFEDRDLA
ncbi:MAG TPA: ABC transporter permease [Gemmataceae bacterium]|nr:ABC transporter permease [Gemmataceae bacterium]